MELRARIPKGFRETRLLLTVGGAPDERGGAWTVLPPNGTYDKGRFSGSSGDFRKKKRPGAGPQLTEGGAAFWIDLSEEKASTDSGRS